MPLSGLTTLYPIRCPWKYEVFLLWPCRRWWRGGNLESPPSTSRSSIALSCHGRQLTFLVESWRLEGSKIGRKQHIQYLFNLTKNNTSHKQPDKMIFLPKSHRYINGVLIFHSNPGTCMDINHAPIFACSKGKPRVAKIDPSKICRKISQSASCNNLVTRSIVGRFIVF